MLFDVNMWCLEPLDFEEHTNYGREELPSRCSLLQRLYPNLLLLFFLHTLIDAFLKLMVEGRPLFHVSLLLVARPSSLRRASHTRRRS